MVRILPAFLVLCSVAVVCTTISCGIYRKRPAKLYSAARKKGFVADAIIVPGVPFYGERWSSMMKARVLWSYVLYKNGIAKNIIYSGASVYSPYCEAKIMALYAEELGIPPTNIFVDTVAEHSTENVFYSYELARTLGFKSIALATDPGQSYLLRRFVKRKFETQIVQLPYIEDTLQQYRQLEPQIDYNSLYKADFVSLKDRKGFWSRLKGTLGRDIPWPDATRKKAVKL